MDAQLFLLIATFVMSVFIKLVVVEIDDKPLSEQGENLGLFALFLVFLYIFGETMERPYDFLAFLSGKHWAIRAFVTLMAAAVTVFLAFGTGWLLAAMLAAIGRFIWYRTGLGWILRKFVLLVRKVYYYAKRGRLEWQMPTVRWTWGW